MEKLSPIGWALRPLKNYAKFSGRASRAEFWWFLLFVMIVYFALLFLIGATAGGLGALGAGPTAFASMGLLGLLVLVFWLAMLIPMIAAQARRLHDTNRSGWWLGAYYLLYAGYLGTLLAIAPQATDGSQPSVEGAGLVMVLGLAFLVYSIVLLVFFCLRGTPGPNNYGEDPYGADMAEVFA
jgi:uncharacterized membrane protein YhaH (DUF805 family)